MIKLRKMFLPILFIAYAIIAFIVKDHEELLIVITILVAIIGSVLLTIKLSKKK